MKCKDIIRYKNIQVHEETFNAFKAAIERMQAHAGKELRVTHNAMLTFLLMDLEATFNAPYPLKIALAKHNYEYWLRREKEGDRTL